MGASSVPNNTSAGNSKRHSQRLRVRLRLAVKAHATYTALVSFTVRHVLRACQLHRQLRERQSPRGAARAQGVVCSLRALARSAWKALEESSWETTAAATTWPASMSVG